MILEEIEREIGSLPLPPPRTAPVIRFSISKEIAHRNVELQRIRKRKRPESAHDRKQLSALDSPFGSLPACVFSLTLSHSLFLSLRCDPHA